MSAKIRPAYLNTKQAGTYIGIGKSTLDKLRCTGGGPAYIQIGRRVLYEPAELDRWVKSHQSQREATVTLNALKACLPAVEMLEGHGTDADAIAAQARAAIAAAEEEKHDQH
jgi:predicted DNA-binding transcriptional regulator AlpA